MWIDTLNKFDGMKRYERPSVMMVEANFELLTMSEMGPGAGDAGSPGFGTKSSVWDDEDTH